MIRYGFHQEAKDIDATGKFAVYGGDDEFTIKTDTAVISLPGLMARPERLKIGNSHFSIHKKENPGVCRYFNHANPGGVNAFWARLT